MDPNKHHGEKAAIIIAAIVAGFMVFLAISLEKVPSTESVNVGSFFSPVYQDRPATQVTFSHRSGQFLLLSALGGIATAFIYVIFAAGAADCFASLRSWAYCDKVEPLSDAVILLIGALWPLTLFFGALIYTFVGIINRSF